MRANSGPCFRSALRPPKPDAIIRQFTTKSELITQGNKRREKGFRTFKGPRARDMARTQHWPAQPNGKYRFQRLLFPTMRIQNISIILSSENFGHLRAIATRTFIYSALNFACENRLV